MDRLLISCAIALAIMAVLSITLAAGGRPGAESAARDDRSDEWISELNLNERLAVVGPDDELKRLADY